MRTILSQLELLVRALCFLPAFIPVFVIATSQSHARTVDLGRKGYWSFSAYYNDDGEFSFCDMTTGSKVGSEYFSLGVSRSGYLVSLFDSSWSLNEGDTYQSKTEIDEQFWEGNAKVIESHTVAMKFAPDSGFGVAFANGSQMNFQIGDFSRALDLRGSSDALKILAQCVISRMKSSNPFGKANGDGNPFE
jgi:hypothetical protein